MKRKFLEKLKKLKNKRAASAAITIAFAALLTTAAITGQQKTDASLTNSGAPGSVSVSSIKNFGGGNFESDYQGAYFYILPDQNNNMLSHALGGTLNRTGRDKKETYRDLYSLWWDGVTLENVTWTNQYSYSRWQGISSVPGQSSQALMFVPYETYNGTSLKSGWKANISAVCYYNRNASSPQNSYKLTTDKAYLNNRIFAPAYNSADFDTLCREGVYYRTFAKWTADKDKKLSESDMGITGLQKKLSSKKAIKSYVAAHPGLQTQGYNLWCYILSLDKTGGTINFNASDKISDFLAKGYNNYRSDRNAAYSTSNMMGVGLSSGLNGDYKLEKWTESNGYYKVTDPIFTKNKFAQREYNLHMLDLMLCAYAASVKQKATDSVQNAWLDAICNYINTDNYSSKMAYSPAFPIAICGGTIARGGDLKEGSKTAVNRVVYVGTQDLVNFAEQLENASDTSTIWGSAGTNSRSVTKSFIGPRIGGSGSSANKLMGLKAGKYYINGINKEAFQFGSRSAEKSDSRLGSTKYVVLKKLPDYYTSYYKRLKSAMNGGEIGQVTNLESTSASQSPRPIKGRGLQLTHEVLASYKSMLLHCALHVTHTRGIACLWSHRRDIDKARFLFLSGCTQQKQV